MPFALYPSSLVMRMRIFMVLIFLQRYEDAFIELDRIIKLCNEFYLGVMPSSFIYESICDDLVKIIKEYKLSVSSKCSSK